MRSPVKSCYPTGTVPDSSFICWIQCGQGLPPASNWSRGRVEPDWVATRRLDTGTAKELADRLFTHQEDSCLLLLAPGPCDVT